MAKRDILFSINLTLIFFFQFSPKLISQSYFGVGGIFFYEVNIGSPSCSCSVEPVYNLTVGAGVGITFTPDNVLLMGAPSLWQIDTLSGVVTPFFTAPAGTPVFMRGLVSVGNGIFYSMDEPASGDNIYKIDVIGGTVINLGPTGYPIRSDMTLYNGEIYYRSNIGVIRVDVVNPSNSSLVVVAPAAPSEFFEGLTASPYCNNLLSVEEFPTTSRIVLINILDGTITPLCNVAWPFWFFTSMLEFSNPAPCNLMFSLNCDESGNVSQFDCLTLNGVPITDQDINIISDDFVQQMTITIAPPIPDAPNEILIMTGAVPNISVGGSGTSMITLTSTGAASIQNFRDALKLIVYKDLAFPLTPGIRTIQAQFTSAAGTMSPIAEYHVEVVGHALIPVHLGADLQLCSGQSATLNAGNPGSTYHWSTGQTTQSINAGMSGIYSVTVSDGVNCPNQDTVEVDVIPVIHVALTGDNQICDNQHANMTIVTDTPFPLDIEITPDPGSPFTFTNLTGSHAFFDTPVFTTTYTITSIISSQPACIEMTDSVQEITVYPTFITDVDTGLCQGDSVWLGYYWENLPGLFPILFYSHHGCDSTVNFNIHILPAVNLTRQATTCDPAGVGIFVTHLNNPTGCDTVVHTTVTLLHSDTTSVFSTSCRSADTGVFTNTLTNQYGCDSMIVTTVAYSMGHYSDVFATSCDSAALGVFADTLTAIDGCDSIVTTTVAYAMGHYSDVFTTSCDSAALGVFADTLTAADGCDSLVTTTVAYAISHYSDVFTVSCDSAALGSFTDTLTAADGCDSLVITQVMMAPADTSYLSSISCDSASIGVFQTHLVNQSGCDSLVIRTVHAGVPDTTYLFSSSCDSASLGVFETHFNSMVGCDSAVILTITYSPSDSTFINSASCDSSQVGIFVQYYTNRFGCDSIVTHKISQLTSSETTIHSTTCDPAAAGMFVHSLTNHVGCDSTVTETIDLLPDDQIFLSSSTCISSQAGVFVNTYPNQYGCDSVVTLTVSLIPADTTILSFKTCDPNQVGNIQNSYTDQNGCDSLVIEQTTLFPLPDLLLQITSDFNGYDISCNGESDGSAMAKVMGIPPFTYNWTTGSTDPGITGLNAGTYDVTVTDANGCITSGEVTLVDPGPFSITFSISQPDCFDAHSGSITVHQTGGVLPIKYLIDGVNFQSSPSFNGLFGGTYQFTALDANDCETKEIIWINVPLSVNVSLGDDRMILPGDTTLIEAIVNVPYDSLSSVTWSGLINPNCATCLSQPVAPIITTTYAVSVTSVGGCADADTMTVFLKRNIDIYVPNIFSPNGDGINDRLVISAGADVEEISSFTIFDRWGNMVFSADHFHANDLNNSWDGTLKGKRLNSAVFAYKLIAIFNDGRSEVRVGDVTLVK